MKKNLSKTTIKEFMQQRNRKQTYGNSEKKSPTDYLYSSATE